MPDEITFGPNVGLQITSSILTIRLRANTSDSFFKPNPALLARGIVNLADQHQRAFLGFS